MASSNDISFSLVTGASSGIGKELARVAARRGSDLLIVSDTDEIHAAAAELAAGADQQGQSDEGGVNPQGLGPAQPRPDHDHDHDHVPQKEDREQLTPAEHGNLANSIERERDA
jgi:NAD(P)-dependent dehydrogenase (short-subunit alcohol dehydrogenase family)